MPCDIHTFGPQPGGAEVVPVDDHLHTLDGSGLRQRPSDHAYDARPDLLPSGGRSSSPKNWSRRADGAICSRSTRDGVATRTVIGSKSVGESPGAPHIRTASSTSPSGRSPRSATSDQPAPARVGMPVASATSGRASPPISPRSTSSPFTDTATADAGRSPFRCQPRTTTGPGLTTEPGRGSSTKPVRCEV